MDGISIGRASNLLSQAEARIRELEDKVIEMEKGWSEDTRRVADLQNEVWSLGQNNEAIQYRDAQKDVELQSLLRERNSYKQAYEQMTREKESWELLAHLTNERLDRAQKCATVSLESYTASEGAYDCE